MNFRQTVVGRQNKWSLVNKLGEGDAGEVYLVESLLQGKPAILKRPRKGPFTGEVLRQAAQIRSEGAILKALSQISFPEQGTRLYTPALLDYSQAEDGAGEHFFIVIEQAGGIDLKSLFQLARSGLLDENRFSTGESDKYFIQQLSQSGNLAEPILIRSLYHLINLLETIHYSEIASEPLFRNERLKQSGLIWNDVKPEHLFWDAAGACLTVIDWGNAIFLESDGITKDRQHSRVDDYDQFISEIGKFLEECNPDLYTRLDWPRTLQIKTILARGNPESVSRLYSEAVKPLKGKLSALHEQVMKERNDLHEATLALYDTSRPAIELLSQWDAIHRQLATLGETPDFASAINVHARVALHMALENDLEAFRQVCESAASLPTPSAEKWSLLCQIANLAIQQTSRNQGISSTEELPLRDDPGRASFSTALSAGIADDWPTLIWDLLGSIGAAPLPDWWDDVSRGVRRVYLKTERDALPPYLVVSRLYYTLQDTIRNLSEPQSRKEMSQSSPPAGVLGVPDKLPGYKNTLQLFYEEVVKKWKEIEPAPPNSGIGYEDITGFSEAVETIVPGAKEKLEMALAHPIAQIQLALRAWENKDFETARQVLRKALVYDPHRRRLALADRAIGTASAWLSAVRIGAGKDTPFYDYLTSTELAGRRLRNQVGQASWLDFILEALKQLRKGFRPADLIMEHPGILDDLPWLNEYRSREILSLPRGGDGFSAHPLKLEREPGARDPARKLSGVVEGRLGLDQSGTVVPGGIVVPELQLGEPLDAWLPEARGSSARVFAGLVRQPGNKSGGCAIKVMRPDSVEYALPLFKEETRILSMLRDVPGITPLLECGFIQIEDGLSLPGDESRASAAHLQGNVVRHGIEEAQNFLAAMDRRAAQGWLPYLAMTLRDPQYNLMKYCDLGHTHGWFLPLREGLLLAIQICDILQSAHDRNIVYRDHKILHYYWDPLSQGVVMIDWNIAKHQPQGLSEAEKQFDIVQFGARALHHILTGRPATGALPVGPNRPEEIEHASSSYPVNWTYDDERLPERVKQILEQTLHQGYTQIRPLREDLLQVYKQIPDPLQNAVQA